MDYRLTGKTGRQIQKPKDDPEERKALEAIAREIETWSPVTKPQNSRYALPGSAPGSARKQLEQQALEALGIDTSARSQRSQTPPKPEPFKTWVRPPQAPTQAPQAQQVPYPVPYPVPYAVPQRDNLLWGILCCVAWIIPIVGLIVSVIGLNQCDKNATDGRERAAYQLCSIGLFLSILNFAFGVWYFSTQPTYYVVQW